MQEDRQTGGTLSSFFLLVTGEFDWTYCYYVKVKKRKGITCLIRFYKKEIFFRSSKDMKVTIFSSVYPFLGKVNVATS